VTDYEEVDRLLLGFNRILRDYTTEERSALNLFLEQAEDDISDMRNRLKKLSSRRNPDDET
jgi:hypothetical protein